MPIDVLIVGQGLAGSLLAWEMMRQQFRVMVVDTGGENASQVAAGLINPVTGQRLVKSVGVDELLPAAIECYRELAAAFNQSFFVPLPMLRIFKNPREREVARQRLLDPQYQAYLQNRDTDVAGINSPFGLLEQRQTGYLRTRPLLDALREYLVANGSYRHTRLDYAEIEMRPCLQWRDLSPRHIVFCEGHLGSGNPWFGRLPFQPAKGEILSCRSMAECPRQILNFGRWLIPNDERHFRIGATFEPGIIDTRPTEAAREHLLQALSALSPDLRQVEVLDHQAGIRPATLDKQPFIGSHPRYPQLHIFNGFGAKGSLAIPWHARRLVAALKQHVPLPLHCHIQRYDETYFPV